ncbi:probable G-protein coupled receptor 139 [Haliotis rufescens]|uniref:probable G-protein coupled receptor 139 n=1 Tax=Haliotis rufescens TaxID=6454 RepID=UPI00201E90A7|nr:probable G-protein coupled receptor 139 [Haliotis rufescens]
MASPYTTGSSLSSPVNILTTHVDTGNSSLDWKVRSVYSDVNMTSQGTPLTSNEEYVYTLTVIGNVERYYMWFILVLGFPGNLASIVTILRMSRLKSATFYVAVLATVDNVALILKTIFMELLHHPNAFSVPGCRFMCFFGLVTAAFSNWILVAMATERFMAVRFPLRVASIWTLRRALVLTVVLFSLLCILHMHIFWTMVNAVHGCSYSPDYRHFTADTWYWISAFVYAFIPCSVLIMFNFLIVRSIQTSSKLRRQLTVERDVSKKPQRVSGNHDTQITIMLISVTIVFVILTIPRCAVILIITGDPPQSPMEQVRHRLVDVLTSMFADSNHAINFFLYFFAARQFRFHFLKTVLSQRRGSTYVTNTKRSSTVREDELPMSS